MRLRKRIRQHHQVSRANDLDSFLFWGGLIITGFFVFVLFLAFNALKNMSAPGSTDVVNQPLEAGKEGSIDDRCPPGQSMVSDRRGIAYAEDGSYKLGAVTKCQ